MPDRVFINGYRPKDRIYLYTELTQAELKVFRGLLSDDAYIMEASKTSQVIDFSRFEPKYNAVMAMLTFINGKKIQIRAQL